MLLSLSITMLLIILVTSLIFLVASHSSTFLLSGISGTMGMLTGFDTLGTREYWPKGQDRMGDLLAATKSSPLVEELLEDL